MTTLDMQYPQAAEIYSRGLTESIYKLMTMSHTCAELDRYLGTNGSANNWMLLKTYPNSRMRRRADYVVSKMPELASVPTQTGLPSLKADAPPVTTKESGTVKTESDPTMLLSVVPAGKLDKVNKILGLMGCEMEEV